MSDALFIVTALSVFSPYINERRISCRYALREKTPLPRRAFRSRQDAQKWASENAPETLNPFQACFTDDDGGSGVTELFVYSIEPGDEGEDLLERSVPMEELVVFVTRLGMVPPHMKGDGRDDARWREWWDSHMRAMPDASRFALWQFLAPCPWRITKIDVEY